MRAKSHWSRTPRAVSSESRQPPPSNGGGLAAPHQVHGRVEQVAAAAEGVRVAADPIVPLDDEHAAPARASSAAAVSPPMPLPTTMTS